MSLKKYPKLHYPDNKENKHFLDDGEVVIQEKADGGNSRFCREKHLDEQFHTDDREIVFGSRNVQFKNKKDENKQFAHAIEHVRERVSDDDLAQVEDTLGGRVTVFGEAMHPHTLEYDFETAPDFVGFDIWDHNRNQFVPPSDAEHFIENVLGLAFAPILDRVPVEEWDDYTLQVPKSAYGDVKAEGVVLKNPTTGVWTKMVRDDFKEKNKETFGKPKKYQESGAEKLSYQYITNHRIRKQVHKLLDEGEWESKRMEMMEDLPEAVIRDMAEEESGNIFMHENWEVDIAEFRSVTSSRCARILRKMINEDQFNLEQ